MKCFKKREGGKVERHLNHMSHVQLRAKQYAKLYVERYIPVITLWLEGFLYVALLSVCEKILKKIN